MQVLSHAPSRYVLLVVGDARDSIAGRLRDATIGAELVCCPSSEGAWSALASGRRYSAVVASGSDPDLTQAAERTGTPVVTVGHRSSPAELAAAIGAVAALVPRVDRPPDLGPASRPESSPDASRRQGRLVAVCGPGGTGASTVAAALAGALGSEPVARWARRAPGRPASHRPTSATSISRRPTPRASSDEPSAGHPAADHVAGASPAADHVAGASPAADHVAGPAADHVAGASPAPGHRAAATPGVRVTPEGGRMRVLLADFALRADQAFLHGADEAASGLLDLLEAGRYRPVTATDVRRHTVPLAQCRLLPGLRRPAHWTALSPAAFDAVLSGLLDIFDLIVADITGDFEGEADTGSFDVEERNHMARRTAAVADVVLVVGGPDAVGSRRLAQVVNDLLDHGVDPARIRPVINRIEPDPLRCVGCGSCTQHTFAAPTPPARVCGLPAAPVGVPLVTGGAGEGLPPAPVRSLVIAVGQLLARLSSPDRLPEMVPVPPGSLGCAAP